MDKGQEGKGRKGVGVSFFPPATSTKEREEGNPFPALRAAEQVIGENRSDRWLQREKGDLLSVNGAQKKKRKGKLPTIL